MASGEPFWPIETSSLDDWCAGVLVVCLHCTLNLDSTLCYLFCRECPPLGIARQAASVSFQML